MSDKRSTMTLESPDSERVSEMFEDTFTSGCSHCVIECACGRTYFDDYNTYDWEEGELEELEAKAKAHPDKYVAVDYSVGTFTLFGVEFVCGCPCTCGKPREYESFILKHARKIAAYLNKKAEGLKKTAKQIEVREVGKL